MRKGIEAIIVLGKGLKKGKIDKFLKCRLDKSLEIYEKYTDTFLGHTPDIICTGRTSFHDLNYKVTEAHVMKEYLLKKKIPKKDIIQEERSLETTGNAFFTKTDIVIPKKYRSICVISNSYHQQRVEYIFRFIYGKRFNLEFEIAQTPVPAKQYERMIKQEHIGVARSFRLFNGVTPGDDQKIYEKIKEFYPKDTFPDDDK